MGTRSDFLCGTGSAAERRRVEVRRVDECETLDDVFRHCLPAFGGAYVGAVRDLDPPAMTFAYC